MENIVIIESNYKDLKNVCKSLKKFVANRKLNNKLLNLLKKETFKSIEIKEVETIDSDVEVKSIEWKDTCVSYGKYYLRVLIKYEDERYLSNSEIVVFKLEYYDNENDVEEIKHIMSEENDEIEQVFEKNVSKIIEILEEVYINL